MAFRRESVLGTHKTRTQGASIAALLARLRTKYGAAQGALAAGTPFFGSPLTAKHEGQTELPGTPRDLFRIEAGSPGDEAAPLLEVERLTE
jgi:hypothetical protein